jgi:hypothetical protein
MPGAGDREILRELLRSEEHLVTRDVRFANTVFARIGMEEALSGVACSSARSECSRFGQPGVAMWSGTSILGSRSSCWRLRRHESVGFRKKRAVMMTDSGRER